MKVLRKCTRNIARAPSQTSTPQAPARVVEEKLSELIEISNARSPLNAVERPTLRPAGRRRGPALG